MLAACGSTESTSASLSDDAPTASTEVVHATEATAVETTAPTPSSTEVTIGGDASDGSVDVETSATAPIGSETTSTEPETTMAAADAPSTPDDGCSIDNSPVDIASPSDGPAPDIAIADGSRSGPLPDLEVRLVNCAGGWANLANELPGAQPLLVWFWAPH